MSFKVCLMSYNILPLTKNILENTHCCYKINMLIVVLCMIHLYFLFLECYQ